ncbi:unnamed protein product [Rotaria magnacalcarata]|uniref:Uncharacterized protein n=1 Tax=Rotaria magnacalcarata TaxID=392030 RepID=A0A816ZKY0_9BILA|nr:unnamed protein product [Rotaria magnacalcarata]CAF4071265.1 unnamed protein product [Rotaria magnacalcarata]
MNEIHIALEYAKKKKNVRLKKNKIYRRKARSLFEPNFQFNDSSDVEPSVINDLSLIKLTSDDYDVDERVMDCGKLMCSTPNTLLNDQIQENFDECSSTSDNSDFHDLIHDPIINNSTLRQYTSMNSQLFLQKLIEFIRSANLSKLHAEDLLHLIQSGLPQPNNFSKNYSDLLNQLSVENLFLKRVACINCKIEIPSSSEKCLKCTTNDTPERVAIIFDVLQELIFSRTYYRLSSTINSYREIFRNQQSGPYK